MNSSVIRRRQSFVITNFTHNFHFITNKFIDFCLFLFVLFTNKTLKRHTHTHTLTRSLTNFDDHHALASKCYNCDTNTDNINSNVASYKSNTDVITEMKRNQNTVKLSIKGKLLLMVLIQELRLTAYNERKAKRKCQHKRSNDNNYALTNPQTQSDRQMQ